jgi:ABC-type proline/glycine betaine transport system permease subunit
MKAMGSVGATTGGGGGGGGIMDSISKINMGAVLKGAAAMVIVAAAVWVFGKAVQEFQKLD